MSRLSARMWRQSRPHSLALVMLFWAAALCTAVVQGDASTSSTPATDDANEEGPSIQTINNVLFFSVPHNGDMLFVLRDKDDDDGSVFGGQVVSLLNDIPTTNDLTAQLDSLRDTMRVERNMYVLTELGQLETSMEDSIDQAVSGLAQSSELESLRTEVTNLRNELATEKSTNKAFRDLVSERLELLAEAVEDISDIDKRVLGLERECQDNEYRRSDGSCMVLTSCVPGEEYEDKEPTPTSDRVCKEYSTCGGDEYVSRAGGHNTDVKCSKLSECDDTSYEAVPGSKSSDRVCRKLTTCKSDQAEVVSPTQTSDRECGPKLGHAATRPAQTCLEIKQAEPSAGSGSYWLTNAGSVIEVYCDMESKAASGPDGGWTLCAKYDKGASGPTWLRLGFGRTLDSPHSMRTLEELHNSDKRWASIDCRDLIRNGARYMMHVGDSNGQAPYNFVRYTNIPADVVQNPTNFWDTSYKNSGTCRSNQIQTWNEDFQQLGAQDGINALGAKSYMLGPGAMLSSRNRDGVRFSNAGSSNCDGSHDDTVYWAWNADDHGCSRDTIVGTGCDRRHATYRFNYVFMR